MQASIDSWQLGRLQQTYLLSHQRYFINVVTGYQLVGGRVPGRIQKRVCYTKITNISSFRKLLSYNSEIDQIISLYFPEQSCKTASCEAIQPVQLNKRGGLYDTSNIKVYQDKEHA